MSCITKFVKESKGSSIRFHLINLDFNRMKYRPITAQCRPQGGLSRCPSSCRLLRKSRLRVLRAECRCTRTKAPHSAQSTPPVARVPRQANTVTFLRRLFRSSTSSFCPSALRSADSFTRSTWSPTRFSSALCSTEPLRSSASSSVHLAQSDFQWAQIRRVALERRRPACSRQRGDIPFQQWQHLLHYRQRHANGPRNAETRRLVGLRGGFARWGHCSPCRGWIGSGAAAVRGGVRWLLVAPGSHWFRRPGRRLGWTSGPVDSVRRRPIGPHCSCATFLSHYKGKPPHAGWPADVNPVLRITQDAGTVFRMRRTAWWHYLTG